MAPRSLARALRAGWSPRDQEFEVREAPLREAPRDRAHRRGARPGSISSSPASGGLSAVLGRSDGCMHPSADRHMCRSGVGHMCPPPTPADTQQLTGWRGQSAYDRHQPMQVRVLVVDDEPNIVDLISMALRFEGFEVTSAATGATRSPRSRPPPAAPRARRHAARHRRLRGRAPPASAQRGGPDHLPHRQDATEDKVRGLTIGGDDYVTKPFSLEELMARIRTSCGAPGQREEESSKLVFADLELDEDTHEVFRGERRSSSPRPSSGCCATC